MKLIISPTAALNLSSIILHEAGLSDKPRFLQLASSIAIYGNDFKRGGLLTCGPWRYHGFCLLRSDFATLVVRTQTLRLRGNAACSDQELTEQLLINLERLKRTTPISQSYVYEDPQNDPSALMALIAMMPDPVPVFT